MKPKIILKRILHRGELRIAIFFDYDDKIVALLRNSIGVTWSNTNKCWYADNNEENHRKILHLFRDIADVDISAIVTHVELPAPVRKKEPDDKGEAVADTKPVKEADKERVW